MNRKVGGLLFTAALCVSSAVQAQTLTPSASTYLAGTAESFLASCRSDLEDTKKRMAAIKASPSPRDAMTTLQAFDTAVLVAGDAEARCGRHLLLQNHPARLPSRWR